MNVIQNLIIDLYDSNPRGENGGYKTGFLEELKKTLIKENVVLDVDYFFRIFLWLRYKGYSKIKSSTFYIFEVLL
ncbi:hypothetical protein ABNIH5_11756 [Acinetobacter baumannii ABNIH5]|nr:hypothetical protein ABNIH5_11756 [Acinetobacter baumannii ABNIH5]